ncbi:MAG: cation diffusion facilitator family transporter [Thermovirgaceae bacterium]|nr:cation diffusion facilitator family transporter [Thermovirgaceae bacterium]
MENNLEANNPEHDNRHQEHHDHGHEGHHHHDVSDTSDRKLAISLALNVGITLAEIAGGILSNSLALLSDAVHNFSDASSLGVSWLARRISRMERTPSHSFGFKRAEILASLVNTVALTGIGVFLMAESAKKFLHPEPVVGKIMLVVAIVGLVGNLVTAWLLHSDSKKSLNIRSAYLHIVMDTLSSVGVIAAALLMMAFGWFWLDPLLTLVVSLYVLHESWPLLKTSIHILMQGTPVGINAKKILERLEDHPDVLDVHHVHLWTTDGNDIYLEAHVALCDDPRPDTDSIIGSLSEIAASEFGIHHVTLQPEFTRCLGGRCSGFDTCDKTEHSH